MRRGGIPGATCDAFGESGFAPVKNEHHFSTPQRSLRGRMRIEEELENISTAERFSHTFSPFEKGLLRNSAFTVITPRNERLCEGEEPGELERKAGYAYT